MSPGDVRTFKRGAGKALVVGVGLWAEKQGEWIHLHLTGPGHTTVTNNPNSERYHRTLFRDLRKTMIEQECWPYGDEGEEVEQDAKSPRFDPVVAKSGEPTSTTVIGDRGPF